jgi:hypothetical protein
MAFTMLQKVDVTIALKIFMNIGHGIGYCYGDIARSLQARSLFRFTIIKTSEVFRVYRVHGLRKIPNYR